MDPAPIKRGLECDDTKLITSVYPAFSNGFCDARVLKICARLHHLFVLSASIVGLVAHSFASRGDQ
jgi:hypothetical protein